MSPSPDDTLRAEIPEGIPAISPGQSLGICPLNIQMPPPFRTSERFARRSSMSLR
ncbi:hypothetical protein [Victivallis vadensis]|uniref:hypothetical protein n=1 Tax=Victivallis vadensis TaxID=172901 RepID=UPI00349F0C0C